MPTLFSRIIDNELPGHFVLRDDHCVVFMTIAPIREGHVLVVPRLPVDEWTDLPPDVATHLFSVAQHVGNAQKAEFGCRRVGLVIAGFEVNHCHLHCIPADEMSDLSFANQQHNVPAERLAAVAARLATRLRAAGVPGAL
jgi:diadenosine tetraphosphate (Ap4A) HIT family hydrolase